MPPEIRPPPEQKHSAGNQSYYYSIKTRTRAVLYMRKAVAFGKIPAAPRVGGEDGGVTSAPRGRRLGGALASGATQRPRAAAHPPRQRGRHAPLIGRRAGAEARSGARTAAGYKIAPQRGRAAGPLGLAQPLSAAIADGPRRSPRLLYLLRGHGGA